MKNCLLKPLINMEKTCTLLNPMEDQSELFNILLKLRQTMTKGRKNAYMHFNLLDHLDSPRRFLLFLAE